MSEQGTGSTEKASEILRRRGDRTSKLQRTIDRGSQRSRAEDSAGDTSAQEEQGRPAKPIRITVDLNAHQYRFLREYCLNTGTKGTAVLRGLLSELAEDQELRSRLTQRLKPQHLKPWLLDLPPEKVLLMIAGRYLSTFDNPVGQRMTRLMVGEVTRSREIVEIFGNAVIKRVLGFLKSYMARHIEFGGLRPHDVRSSARALIGMLLPQAGGKLFFAAIREDELTDEEHIETAVNLFLEGLRPEW